MKTLILISLFLTTSALAQSDSPVTPTILNFQTVEEGKIYRGARPTEDQWKELQALHIKTVIDLQGGDYRFPLKAYIAKHEPGELPAWIEKEKAGIIDLGINFVSKPLNSLGSVTPDEIVEIDQVLSILKDPNQQPVYIHCEHGKDRTGLLIALYRVESGEMSPKEARKEWRKYGHSGIGQIITHALDDYFDIRLGLE